MKLKLIFIILSTFIVSNTLANDKCKLGKQISKYIPKYAKGFEIEYFEKGKILRNHIAKDEAIFMNDSCTIFNKKLNKIAITSTTYIPILKFLNKLSTISAFQGIEYIVGSDLVINKLTDLPYKISTELLVNKNFDLVIGYANNFQTSVDKLRNFKIPVIIIDDYLEEDPLARLEWSIYIASFFNEEEKMKVEFSKKEDRYLTLKKIYSNLSKVPLLVGDIQGGKWITPGNRSNVGILLKDAGAKLVLDVDSSKTEYVGIELALEKSKEANVWFVHNLAKTKKDLNHKFYELFKVSKIYNNNKITNEKGYNAYWQEANFYPEILIEDIHNALNDNLNLKWYKKLD